VFPANTTGIRRKRHLALRLGGLIPAYDPGNLPVLTADRAWADLNIDLNIILVRP